MYRHYRTNAVRNRLFSYRLLLAVLWKGDSKIEQFKKEWLKAVDDTPVPPPIEDLADMLFEQMVKSSLLRGKMEDYRRTYKYKEKSYPALLEIMDEHLRNRHEQANRQKFEQELVRKSWGGSHAAPAPSKASQGKPKTKGAEGKKTEKKQSEKPHSGKGVAQPAMSPTPAAPVEKGKSKGKGKGKDKGK